jgi:hypothetical protein
MLISLQSKDLVTSPNKFIATPTILRLRYLIFIVIALTNEMNLQIGSFTPILPGTFILRRVVKCHGLL